MVHSYDQHRLVSELGRIAPGLRVAFAAACAERLMPAYGRFSDVSGRGNPTKLAAILNGLWEDILGVTSTSAAEWQARLNSCMALIPREDEGPWVQEQAVAEDGAAAVAYAIRCLQSGDPKEAAWAGQRAYDAVDHFVIHREDIDVNQPGSGEKVLSHPLVQAELARQRRDLEDLLLSKPASADRLRDRAREEAADVFRITPSMHYGH